MIKNYLSAALSIMTCGYTVWYMHFAPPHLNSGALSTIGLSHRLYFAIWGVLTFSALAFSLILAYKRYAKTKVYLPLLAVAGVGMALTLLCRFDYDIKTEYVLHCIGSLTFSAVTGGCVFLIFLLNYKKNILFKVFTYCTAGILLVDTVCLFIWKETGLIEVLPIFTGLLMLGIINLRRERIEVR